MVRTYATLQSLPSLSTVSPGVVEDPEIIRTYSTLLSLSPLSLQEWWKTLRSFAPTPLSCLSSLSTVSPGVVEDPEIVRTYFTLHCLSSLSPLSLQEWWRTLRSFAPTPLSKTTGWRI